MKTLKWIVKQWWLYAFVFVLSLTIPFAINELYKKGNGYITLWQASDVLAFYGSYLSFIGTAILGIVAVYQNKKAHKLNEQMQILQQAQFVSMISVCGVMISQQSANHPKYVNKKMYELEYIDLKSNGFQSSRCYHIDIMFCNSSQYPIVQCVIHAGKRGNGNSVFYGIVDYKETSIYIPEQGKQAIRFIVPSKMFEETQNYNLALCVDFINVFNYKTSATIQLEDLENAAQANKYSYRLSKLIDVNVKI